MDQSFQEQREVVKPLQEAFKENLENYTVTEEDTVNELSCAICLDIFQLKILIFSTIK